MTGLDLDELRKIAQGATPGPWKAEGIPYDGCSDPVVVSEDGTYICQTVYDMQSSTQKHDVDADTYYISTFDPPTVLELLEQLKKHEELLRESLDLCDDITSQFVGEASVANLAQRIKEVLDD